MTSKVQPGSIVLFHNAALHTPEALPGVIESLLQQGYTFVPISELIVPGTCGQDYSIDHTGRQCPGGTSIKAAPSGAAFSGGYIEPAEAG